ERDRARGVGDLGGLAQPEEGGKGEERSAARHGVHRAGHRRGGKEHEPLPEPRLEGSKTDDRQHRRLKWGMDGGSPNLTRIIPFHYTGSVRTGIATPVFSCSKASLINSRMSSNASAAKAP